MDENFAPASSIDKKRLKALCIRSDAKGLFRFASHGAALLVTAGGIYLNQGSVWIAPALLAHGIVLVFLFAPLHETIHRTAFRRRWLNDSVAWLCGVLLMLPPAYFRAFHFAHHRDTQDLAKDPELAAPKPASLGGYLLLVSGLPFWRERVVTTLLHAAGRVSQPFIPRAQGAVVVREARMLLAIYGGIAVLSLASESWVAMVYWLLPLLLGQPFLRMYLLAEHTGCPLVPDMLSNSRTTQSNAALRRLAWNMPYHAEHHAYPALPFHALPEAHELLKAQISIQASGYLAVQWEIIAGLRR